MSVAAAQYARFKAQAVREDEVFTFRDGGGYLAVRVGGREVMPFWSSRRHLERVQRDPPKYRSFTMARLPLSTFLEWLPKMDKDGVHIGTNWCGKRLTGYDVSAQDLQAGLQHWIHELKR